MVNKDEYKMLALEKPANKMSRCTSCRSRMHTVQITKRSQAVAYTGVCRGNFIVVERTTRGAQRRVFARRFLSSPSDQSTAIAAAAASAVAPSKPQETTAVRGR